MIIQYDHGFIQFHGSFRSSFLTIVRKYCTYQPTYRCAIGSRQGWVVAKSVSRRRYVYFVLQCTRGGTPNNTSAKKKRTAFSFPQIPQNEKTPNNHHHKSTTTKNAWTDRQTSLSSVKPFFLFHHSADNKNNQPYRREDTSEDTIISFNTTFHRIQQL